MLRVVSGVLLLLLRVAVLLLLLLVRLSGGRRGRMTTSRGYGSPEELLERAFPCTWRVLFAHGRCTADRGGDEVAEGEGERARGPSFWGEWEGGV